MPPTATLPERDQAFIGAFSESLSTAIADALRPAPPASGSEGDLENALKGASPGSTIKWKGLDIVLPAPTEPEAAAKTQQKPAEKQTTPAQVDGEDAEAELEQGAKLLAPIERPLAGLKFGGIEVGKLGLGLGLGLVSTEVLNGMISPIQLDASGQPVLNAEGNTQVNWTNVGAKYGLAAGWAIIGPNFMGKDATIGAVAYPLAQAIGDTVPFDRAVSWIVAKLKGNSAAAQQVRRTAASSQNRVPQRQLPSPSGERAGAAQTMVYNTTEHAFRR